MRKKAKQSSEADKEEFPLLGNIDVVIIDEEISLQLTLDLMLVGNNAVSDCVEAFKNGKPCMVFDSAFRERETDLLWPATAATR